MSNIALPLIASLVILSCSGPDPRNEAPTDSVEVHVEMVALDNHDTPVVVLEENEGSRVLNIWIGPFEAQSIAAVMEDREMPRPNTHDLGVRMLRVFEGEVDRVVVSDLRRGVYFAVMTVRNGDELVELDARPSDAIAIALRVGAPIFVNPVLFEPPARGPRINEDGSQNRDRDAQQQAQSESI